MEFNSIEKCIDFLYEQSKKHFQPDLGMDEFKIDIHYSPIYADEEYWYIVTASICEREKWRPSMMLVGCGHGNTMLKAALAACEDSKYWDNNQKYRKEAECEL